MYLKSFILVSSIALTAQSAVGSSYIKDGEFWVQCKSAGSNTHTLRNYFYVSVGALNRASDEAVPVRWVQILEPLSLSIPIVGYGVVHADSKHWNVELKSAYNDKESTWIYTIGKLIGNESAEAQASYRMVELSTSRVLEESQYPVFCTRSELLP